MLANYPVNAILPTVDVERARAFYSGTLGLPLVDDTGEVLIFGAGGGTRIALYLRPGGGPAAHTVAYWVVDDLEAAVRQLSAGGVRFEHYDYEGLRTDELGIADLGSERSAWFKDPDGNYLAVTQIM